MAKICVVRLGHRIGRDQRITTHVFLVARAFGATGGVLCGDEDDSVLKGMARVSELWGGHFTVAYEKSWASFVRERKKAGWAVAHLTMYGEDFARGAAALHRGRKNLLILVGAGKVPREAYELADFNLAVGNQPHSEVAAVALFLNRYFGGVLPARKFKGKLSVVPDKCGKVVVRV